MAPKRTSGQIRSDHKGAGALLLKFILPAGDDWEEFLSAALQDKVDELVASMPANVLFPDQAMERLNFATMQRKGFRVTVDTGCCSPDPQYQWSAGGGRPRGYAKMFTVMHGCRPGAQDTAPDPTTGRAETLTLSHLCKRGFQGFGCCNRRHIDVEALWRNALRNYCFWVTQNPQDDTLWPIQCACVKMLTETEAKLRDAGDEDGADKIAQCIGRPCLRPYQGILEMNEQPAVYINDQREAVEQAFMHAGGKACGPIPYVWAEDGTLVDDPQRSLCVCWEDEAELLARDKRLAKRPKPRSSKKAAVSLEAVVDQAEAVEEA